METLVESAIRATVMAAAVGLVLATFRIASPRLAHRAWMAVTLTMLGLPLLVALLPQARVPILAPTTIELAAGDEAGMTSPAANAAGRFAAAEPGADVANRAPARMRTWALVLYLVGLLALLLRLALGVWMARRFLAGVRTVHGHLTHSGCTAPVTIGLLQPRVVLPEDWRTWHADVLAVVLAHEAEHVRRRDPLMTLVTLLNRAVFWFHPLAWWLHHHTAILAERACDDAVIASGHDREDYGKCLLGFAQRVASKRSRVEPLAIPMPGGALRARLEAIADDVPIMPLTRLRRIGLAAACLPCIVTAALASPAPRQLPDVAFEVASVKPNTSTSPLGTVHMQPTPGGALVVTNTTLRELVRLAHGLQLAQLAGGPEWFAFERFDVNAKAPAGDRPSPRMLQRLLADRFGVVVHTENRELPAFVLEPVRDDGRLGPALRPSSVDCDALATLREQVPASAPVIPGSRQECDAFIGSAPRMLGGGVTMTQLANSLARQVRGVVVDRTGLQGRYDLELQWRPEFVEAPPPGAPPAQGPPRLNGVDIDPEWPEIFTALRQQLGLKLEARREQVPVIVVDQASRPTAN